MKKIKQIKLEDILVLFIILCPILDMLSFIFRNHFGTSKSPSTFLRPLIPVVAIVIIFFKNKIKLKLFIGFCIYAIYGIIHLILYKLNITGISYGTLSHEAQYIINYSYMILNLFIYIFMFYKKDTAKLKNGVLIALAIYIISIYISILTGTSSSTYVEGMGYKGWFEQGNSLSSIFMLGLLLIMPLGKNKKYIKYLLPLLILIGIFLTTLIGTRVGMFGFVLVCIAYIAIEASIAIKNKLKLNKKVIIVLSLIAIVLIGIVVFAGSTTLQRRKHLESIENNIIDSTTGEASHIGGDILKFKEEIEAGVTEEGKYSEAEKQSILELYEFANEHNVKNTDRRTQQLAYNVFLVKNQRSLPLILFGNGHLNNYGELILEMEIPAFLLNFGIIGFVLYFVPFLSIFIYGVYIFLKKFKVVDTEFMMYLVGCFVAFALSFFAGYTFFNSSTMMIIIVLNIMLLNKCEEMKKLGDIK
ncbi:MAG: O-antigen ligase family protein [Clostridia bacterium]|nr:O-antigen ligase family protein [Clostridia bacterium]